MIFYAFNTSAQMHEHPLITDRPDQTESPNAVRLGSIQFESGFVYTSFIQKHLESDMFTLASSLIRYGLFKNFELRIGFEYLTSRIKENNIESSVYGFGPLHLGGKYHFMHAGEVPVDAGVLFGFTLPIGERYFRPKNIEPELIISIAHYLSDIFSLATNLGTVWNSYEKELIGLYTLVFGISLTEKIGIFTEVFGNYSSGNSTSNSITGGITYLLSNNLQLDSSAGFEHTNYDRHFFINTGISVRFGK
jgi:hypothetical protein